jgi:peptidoglycan/xylan/chitin deacetylase (PgdA/CDA1 family)
MRIALKVDVDTYRGTLEGVPALLDLFKEHGVRATFLFSLGPDHTGRAIRRVFRPGFLSKVQRTSVTEHYGFKTLMYGVLLPGPHIGRKAGDVLRSARDQGHEVGIHCYDHVRWQDFVAKRDEAWTRRELERARRTFREVFSTEPTTHGAAGWQLNPYLLKLEQEAGFAYASDVRGENPFYPSMQNIDSRCVQIPTTLPTLDELIGRDGITADNVHETVFQASRKALAHGHVYTLHAELEGMKLLPVMQRLLRMWRDAGDELVATEDIFNSLDVARLPRKQVVMAEIEGRSGTLGVEGPAV